MTRTARAARAAAPRSPRKRAYRMHARAAAAAATLVRIREAATALFNEHAYDDVSLEAVARRAGVSLPTVLRPFGSKDALFVACARAFGEREWETRTVSPGDVAGVARVLARSYERLLPLWKRYIVLEQRFPAVAQVMEQVRRGHVAWLADAFGPFLVLRPGRARSRQLAALFGATEIYVWWTWKEHLGLEPAEAEAAMREVLEAIVGSWKRGGKEPGT